MARCLEKIQLSRDMTVMWVYPSLDEVIMSVGLEEVGIYVLRRHNTVSRYIATCPILELCLTAERHPGA